MRRVVLGLLAGMLAFELSAHTGTITGRVFYCSKECERAPGAVVLLIADGSVLRTTRADHAGSYVFLGVPPGHEYALEAEAAGLTGWRMHTRYLYSGQTQRVDLQLELSSLNCTLGRRWQIDPPPSEPGVFRARRGRD